MLKPVLVERPVPGSGEAAGPRTRSVTVNLAESPLSWLASRGLLTNRQLLAGETLRRDHERSGLPARVTAQWDAPPIGRGRRSVRDPSAGTIAQLDARKRFLSALDHVGPGLSDIAWRVVCEGEAMLVAERGLGWPARSGRIILTLALDRIADYYRLPAEAKDACGRER